MLSVPLHQLLHREVIKCRKQIGCELCVINPVNRHTAGWAPLTLCLSTSKCVRKFRRKSSALASGKLLKFPQMWISNRGGNMNLTKSKLQFGVAPKEEQLGKDDEYQESIHPKSEKLCGLSFLFQNILCSMAENLIFWRSLDSTDHGF